MNHRSLSDIFPAYYPPPDEEDMVRKCRAHFATAQRVEDITRWIERESCPYMREAYAESMRLIISQSAVDDDMDYFVRADIRDEIEACLNRIIRYSHTDQLAEEMCMSEQPVTHNETPHQQHVTAMEKQLNYLTQEVANIKNQLTTTLPQILWPTYAANVAEGDKHAFENYLRTICQSGKRKLTQQVKTYLEAKEKDGTIIRPKQQNTEWEILKSFGYPYREKTYYNP